MKTLQDHMVEVLGNSAMQSIVSRVRVVASGRDFLTALYVDNELVLTDDIAGAYREIVEAIFDIEWFEQLHNTELLPHVPEKTDELDKRIERYTELTECLRMLETRAAEIRAELGV